MGAHSFFLYFFEQLLQLSQPLINSPSSDGIEEEAERRRKDKKLLEIRQIL